MDLCVHIVLLQLCGILPIHFAIV
jgi:hypothetical protein